MSNLIGKFERDTERKRDDHESEDSQVKDNNDMINLLIRKLDNRKIPNLDNYEEESGLDFLVYLNRFENYYSEQNKCCCSLIK